MGKGVRRISKGCRGSHGFAPLRAASDGCLRRKGYVKTARLVRQRGSYLEFLKSHLPSCPLQRFFSPLAPFHPPRNPFTQGGFLARDIVISGVFHSSVYSDIFFFFSLSSFTDRYVLSVAGRRVRQKATSRTRRRGWRREFSEGWRWRLTDKGKSFNFNKPILFVEINFINSKELNIYTRFYFYLCSNQISYRVFLIIRTKRKRLSTLFISTKRKKEKNTRVKSFPPLHEPHNKPFPSTPYNTSKTFPRRGGEGEKKEKRGGAWNSVRVINSRGKLSQ